MKKIPLLLFLSAAASFTSTSLFAGGDYNHIARDGDRLHPGISASDKLILSVMDSAKTVLLSPDAVRFHNSLDAASYIDSDTISYIQSTTKHRFILHGDTLSYIGFENRASDFHINTPVSMATFPLSDVQEMQDSWTGYVIHDGGKLLKRTKGISKSRIEKGWNLTDGTDTISNATRLVWTLDMSYADTDSISSSMTDSIESSTISDMRVEVSSVLSERLMTERSLWFSESARYPVLTDTRISRVIQSIGAAGSDTVPISHFAVYYPAQFQYSDTGEEPDKTQPVGNRNYDGYQYHGPNDGNIDSGSLTVGEPTVSGNRIDIPISSQKGPGIVTLTLYSDSGIKLSEPEKVTVGTLPQSCSIDIPSGWQGVLLIRVETSEESFTRKVII